MLIIQGAWFDAYWFAVFIIGYFLSLQLDKIEIKKKCITIVCLIMGWVIGNMIPTILTYIEMYYMKNDYLFYDNPFLIWSFCATLCLDAAIWILSDCLKKYEGVTKVVSYLGGLTFGIYLFADKFIKYVDNHINWWGDMNAVMRVLILDIMIFGVCAIISAVFKKLPVIKVLM